MNQFKLNNKQGARYFLFFLILWLVLIVKTILNPVDIEILHHLLSGIKANNNVSVVIDNVDDELQHQLQVYRINHNNEKIRVYRESSDRAVFKDSHYYWYGIDILIPDESLAGVNFEVKIGSDTFTINKYNLLEFCSINLLENSVVNITFNSFEKYSKNNSLFSIFHNILNYRGDLYLILSTFIFSFLLTIIAVFVSIKVSFVLTSELSIFFIITINCLIVFKLLVSQFLLPESVMAIFDFIIITNIILFGKMYGNNVVSSGSKQNKISISSNNTYVIFFAILFLLLIFQNIFYMFFREATLDEGKYFIRGYWYAKGLLSPYSKYDGNMYAPIFFIIIGFWQSIMERLINNSLFIIRLLPLMLSLFNIALILFILKKTLKSKLWTFIGSFLIITSPFANLLYTNAHPMVLINTIILLVFLMYIYREHIPLIYAVVVYSLLYIILFFTRKNMVLVIPWLFLFQVIYSNSRIKELLFTVLLSIFLVVSILLFAPEKLSHQMVALPKIDKIVYSLGILDRNDITGQEAVQRDTVNNWNKRKITPWLSFRLRFWSFSNRYYLIFSMLNVFAIFLPFNGKDRRKNLGRSAAIIFLITAILHAIGATTPGNVFGYIHYTFSLGVIAAAYGLKSAGETFKKEKIRLAFIVLVLFSHTVIFYQRSIYKEYISPFEAHHLASISKFSTVLSKYGLDKEQILIIDTNRYIAQMAVHFAGGMPEPATLNLPYSHKKPINENEIDYEVFKERNWWSNEIMHLWISKEKSVVILYEEDKYAPAWKDDLEKYMNPVEHFYFPYIGWYTIYTR